MKITLPGLTTSIAIILLANGLALFALSTPFSASLSIADRLLGFLAAALAMNAAVGLITVMVINSSPEYQKLAFGKWKPLINYIAAVSGVFSGIFWMQDAANGNILLSSIAIMPIVVTLFLMQRLSQQADEEVRRLTADRHN